ncbi:MAG: hypothetical protein IK041_06400 [Bacteroidales bacterium]|nr:hypothetical protein [Bacteroidales bacterium]
MKPLRFKSVRIGTIWGSEEWILSAMEGRETVCISQAEDSEVEDDCGSTLSSLVAKYGEALLGKRVCGKFGTRFPLLVKYINSRQQLSVQVHPNDDMADRKGLPNGKTEMWYVLEAEKDTELLIGFSKRFSKKEFAQVVSNSIQEKDVLKGEKTLEDVLNRFSPQRGDWYFIPAGTVHSIGAGCRILEIQQPSDTTYRLYDFNRVDIEGKRRHLDLEDALDAIDFEETQENYVEVQRNVFDKPHGNMAGEQSGGVKIIPLARCAHFVSNFINFDSSCNSLHSNNLDALHVDNTCWDTFTLIVCTGGSGTLFYKEFGSGCIRQSQTLVDGDLFLIPAELGAVDILSTGGLQLVETHLELPKP